MAMSENSNALRLDSTTAYEQNETIQRLDENDIKWDQKCIIERKNQDKWKQSSG